MQRMLHFFTSSPSVYHSTSLHEACSSQTKQESISGKTFITPQSSLLPCKPVHLLCSPLIPDVFFPRAFMGSLATFSVLLLVPLCYTSSSPVLSLSFSWIAECLSSMSLVLPGDLLWSNRKSWGLVSSREGLGLLNLPPSLVRGL
mmetsp:Transcript_24574/g.80548  ORF Transcript_24574/g.80548 Transcript_24574/m.80548 type:complete len:145 (+) Transcript_24574:62-496(+)